MDANKRAYQQRRRKQLEADKRCVSCGKPRDRFPQRTCKRCQKLSRARQEKIRQKVITHYGGVCACCGYNDRRFLSIDHIIPLKPGKRSSITTGYGLWCWIRRQGFPAGFQVLCYNCNFGKRGRPYCPHQEETGR